MSNIYGKPGKSDVRLFEGVEPESGLVLMKSERPDEFHVATEQGEWIFDQALKDDILAARAGMDE